MTVMDFLNSIINFLLGWTLRLGYLWSLIIISFILALLTTLVYKYFTDQDALKKIKEDNKKIQEEIKANKDNPQKMAELQKEALHKGFIEPMKHQIKPMIITILPFILIFGWLRTTYADVGSIFLGLEWFWTYFIFSFIFSMILRKALKVY